MKYNQKLLISVLVSSQLLGIGIPTIANINVVQAQEVVQQGVTPEETDLFDELVQEGLYSNHLNNELIKLTEESENIESYADVKEVIGKFTTIYTEVSEERIYNQADLYLLDSFKALDIHNNIMEAIHEYGNTSLMINYANNLVMGYVEADPAYDGLILDLVENNEFNDAKRELFKVKNMFELYKEKLFDKDFPEIKVSIIDGQLRSEDLEFMLGDDLYRENIVKPEFVDKSDEFGQGVGATPEQGETVNGPSYTPSKGEHTPSQGLEERTGSYYEYDADKGIRYLVTYRIRMENGKEVRTENRRIDATGLTSMWSDRLRTAVGNASFIEPTDFNFEEEEVSEEKKLTLQYSLNKDDLFPSYIDTGIYTDEDGNADYKAMHDVLYQIAVNATDGYLVEDSDKLLIVVEGVPVYITEVKDSYSQKEIEKIFNEFKTVDLIVRETRIGTTDTLEWQLRTGKTQSLIIDGDKIDLVTQPEVRGNRVVLPIVETFKAIGAEVTEVEGIMIAHYKGIEIKLEKGVSEARVDDKLIDMSVPVEASERGFYTGNITPIFKELGIDSEWDEQESSLILLNTERQNKSDESKETEEETEKETEEE